MNTEESQGWLDYFENVLGVQSVLQARQPDQGPVALQVVFLSPRELSQEADALLTKMMQAMKLHQTQTQVLIWPVDNLPSAQYYVCFSEKIFSSLEHPRKIQTFSPEDLLQNPGLKKKSWEHLQIVMRNLTEFKL